MYHMYHNGKDITDYCSPVSMKDSIDAIAKELTFSIAINKHDKYLRPPDIEPGDKLTWKNDSREIFSGIVIESSLDGSVVAEDYGFYLNKQEIIFQTSKAAVSDAIRSLCTKCGVPAGEICSIPTKISKIWIGSSPDQILKDMLELATAEQGKNYLYRVERGKLNVRPYPTQITTAYYKQKSGKQFDITWSLGDVSVKKSMAEMRNRVVAVKGNDSDYTVLATAEDVTGQKRYGTLATTLSIDDDQTKQADTMAKAKLRELNAITHDVSISEMLGSDDVSAGVIMNFSSAAYGVQGLYLVTEVTHNYANADPARHTMSLTVQKVVSG